MAELPGPPNFRQKQIPSSKYILVKSGSHGLANRLLVVSTAIRLAKQTGAKLIIDWHGSSYGGVSFWDVFRLEESHSFVATHQDPSLLNHRRSNQNAWEGCYEKSISEIYNHVSGKGEYAGVDLQEIPPISGLKTYFSGRAQKEVLVLCGYQKKGQAPIQLLQHLRLTKEWSERLQNISQTLPEAIRQRRYVGVHIRAAAGDHFPAYQIGRLISYLKKHPSLDVFLATDLAVVEDEIRDQIGDRLIQIARTYAAAPSTISASREPMALHAIEHSSRLEADDLLFEAIRDLWLLSQGYAFFAQPYSTFSEFACLFSCCPPWRLHLNAPATKKYQLGNYIRGAMKYGVNRPSFIF